MSETSFTGTNKTIGTKHRLSLLSSKQAGVRLKSEDQSDPKITILASAAQEQFTNFVDTKNGDYEHQVEQRKPESHTLISSKKKTQELINDEPQNAEQSRMNISREDLIGLLSLLKSELQSKEIALAAIKCEQLKRLINPIEISRSSLANTYIQLQDRFRLLDQNNNSSNSSAQHSSASGADIPDTGKANTSARQDNDLQNEDAEQESLNILNTLLELLDRHPLLALPRDSIYCLDYNCNELSTKNYLNLKIQHLDNLINQHRRFRYYMNERLKRSEQRFSELAREYELEKSLRNENEKSLYKSSGKATLLKHISQLTDAIEKEKRDKQTLVMTLLNELLDEQERSESLAKKLSEKENTSAKLAMKDRLADKEKLLKLEAENTTLSLQVKKQALVFSKEKNELKTRISDLETENSNLKSKLEQLDKRPAPAIKPAIGTIGAKEANRLIVQRGRKLPRWPPTPGR